MTAVKDSAFMAAQSMPVTPRKRRLDIVLFLVISAIAALIGTWFVGSNIVKKFHFYQENFAPAVMAACGKGFVQPRPAPESMTAFLEVRQDSFNCSTIPPGQESVATDFFQNVHRNLMLTIAGWWRALGVSWGSLATLYGLVYGLSAGFTYLFFRTVMRRPLAAALTFIFILSPPQLFNLPHLRDYIKAPFMLAAIAMIAWLLKGHIARQWTILLLAVTGVLIGIGIGFRFDLAILVPLVAAVILFMQPGSWLSNLKIRLAATATFIACFLIAASPTLIGMSGGGNMPHVVILGLMEEFDQRLGFEPAFYGLGYHYLDMYANTLANSFAYANGYAGPEILYPTTLYDSVGISYIVDVYKNFPADVFARYLASLWRILHLPIVAPVTFEDLYFFYDQYRPAWLMKLTHHPIWDLVLIMAISTGAALIASHGFKLLISVFLVVCYLCGYPFLQFGVRHYFYLEVIGLWIFGLCIQFMLQRPWRNKQLMQTTTSHARRDKRIWFSRSLPTIGSFALIFVLPFALLGVLRLYQSKHLYEIFGAYAVAPTIPVANERITGSAGSQVLRVKYAARPKSLISVQGVETLYLVATFDSKRCKKDSVQVGFKYQSVAPTYDFSQAKSIGIDGHTRLFFPAFFRQELSAFIGVEMPSEDFACLVSLEQLAGAPPLRIPVTITLPQNWTDSPRYRTFH